MGAGRVRPDWTEEGLPALIQTVLEQRFSTEELPNSPVGWRMQLAVRC